MGYKAKNNATSTLAVGIGSAATSLAVETAHGDRFPAITAPDYSYLTLENAAGTREVVKLTARALGADVMTVERGQDGTAAAAWSAGAIVDLRLTAQVVTEAFDHISDSVSAHAASAVEYTPTGGLAAVSVQAALDELVLEKAPLDSPALSGVPTTPTAPTVTDTTQVASTAFVKASQSLGLATIDETGLVNGQKVGYRNIPGNGKTDDYTLALTDAGKHLYYTGGAGKTVTLPLNAVVPFAVGDTVTVINNGSASLSLGASATLHWAGTDLTGPRVLAVKGLATMVKVATDTWFITGVRLT